jgi:hypothetical protein
MSDLHTNASPLVGRAVRVILIVMAVVAFTNSAKAQMATPVEVRFQVLVDGAQSAWGPQDLKWLEETVASRLAAYLKPSFRPWRFIAEPGVSAYVMRFELIEGRNIDLQLRFFNGSQKVGQWSTTWRERGLIKYDGYLPVNAEAGEFVSRIEQEILEAQTFDILEKLQCATPITSGAEWKEIGTPQALSLVLPLAWPDYRYLDRSRFLIHFATSDPSGTGVHSIAVKLDGNGKQYESLVVRPTLLHPGDEICQCRGDQSLSQQQESAIEQLKSQDVYIQKLVEDSEWQIASKVHLP